VQEVLDLPPSEKANLTKEAIAQANQPEVPGDQSGVLQCVNNAEAQHGDRERGHNLIVPMLICPSHIVKTIKIIPKY
jgi:hypothetical protein